MKTSLQHRKVILERTKETPVSSSHGVEVDIASHAKKREAKKESKGGGAQGEKEERPLKRSSLILSALCILAEVRATFLNVAYDLQLGDGTLLVGLIFSKSAKFVSAFNVIYPKFVHFFFRIQHSGPWWCILYAKSRFTSRSGWRQMWLPKTSIMIGHIPVDFIASGVSSAETYPNTWRW